MTTHCNHQRQHFVSGPLTIAWYIKGYYVYIHKTFLHPDYKWKPERYLYPTFDEAYDRWSSQTKDSRFRKVYQ